MTKQLQINLTEYEIEYIRKKLGREPNLVEWGVFEVTWSEHCSYKSSRPVLKILPTEADYVIVGPGQDAGVIDIGDGLVLVFKIESHNHPSAIDPYNGAATGIGGIIRDIMCMGARPIALLDILRFGPPTSSHSVWLLKNVVRGIADYGNCVGIPTVAGEVEFDESFERNCLVNVACVGIGRKDRITPSIAPRPGDLFVLVGGSTGRDGIHGAAFASKTLSDRSEEDRPAVQIGDPFTKKVLIDATMEALETGFVVGLKDLGGGGLATALSEMTALGNTGADIDLSKVHLREDGMTPYEIILSESQERMLFVIDPRGFDVIRRIFEKYEIPYSVIGHVTNTGRLVAKFNGKIVIDLPSKLVARGPVIERKARKPKYIDELKRIPPPSLPEDLEETILKLLSSPNIASKEWIFTQYDHEVGVRTIVKPGQGDAAVLRILNTNKAIAVKADANSKHTYLDPYNGAAGSLAEACRNVAAVGARPLAFTDNANFGSPENPEVFWQFKEAFRGLADMARGLGIPCVGGNVSFYNEDEVTGKIVKPSIVVVCVGLIEDLSHITTMSLKSPDDYIGIIGYTRRELGGSEYYYWIHNIVGGQPPKADAVAEKKAINFVLECIKRGIITSAHDISNGGLAIALSEMSIAGNLGALIDLTKIPSEPMRIDELLFSESYARFLIEIKRERINQFENLAREMNAVAAVIGQVTIEKVVRFSGFGVDISCDLDTMSDVWHKSLERMLEGIYND